VSLAMAASRRILVNVMSLRAVPRREANITFRAAARLNAGFLPRLIQKVAASRTA
jgi:hypothetical protein